jgi:hypothetical protein
MKLDIFLKKRQPLKTIKIKKTQEKRKKNTIKDKIIFFLKNQGLSQHRNKRSRIILRDN